jgi:hypothetical protein
LQTTSVISRVGPPHSALSQCGTESAGVCALMHVEGYWSCYCHHCWEEGPQHEHGGWVVPAWLHSAWVRTRPCLTLLCAGVWMVFSLCLCLSGVESRCDLCGERQQDGASMPQIACMACILHGHCDCACAVVTGWAPKGERPHHLDRGPCTCAPCMVLCCFSPSQCTQAAAYVLCAMPALAGTCGTEMMLAFPLRNKNDGE